MIADVGYQTRPYLKHRRAPNSHASSGGGVVLLPHSVIIPRSRLDSNAALALTNHLTLSQPPLSIHKQVEEEQVDRFGLAPLSAAAPIVEPTSEGESPTWDCDSQARRLFRRCCACVCSFSTGAACGVKCGGGRLIW